jgi:hypothetical protein
MHTSFSTIAPTIRSRVEISKTLSAIHTVETKIFYCFNKRLVMNNFAYLINKVCDPSASPMISDFLLTSDEKKIMIPEN